MSDPVFEYPASADELQLVGAHFAEPIDGGIRPHRLPEQYLSQIPTDFMRLMVDFASGVRLRFSTSATTITVRLAVQPLEMPGVAPVASAVIDLVVDGVVVESRAVTGRPAQLDIQADSVVAQSSDPVEAVFDGLPAGDKAIELWLPHTATVDLFGIRTDAPIRRSPAPTAPVWVHHGSSISHCLESSRPTRTWPAVASRLLDLELDDLSFAGNALLDPFVARAIRDAPADLITLKLGINLVNVDSMRVRAFVPSVHGFIDTIREGHPHTPILVISPIYCPSVETRPGPTSLDPASGRFASTAVDPDAADALTLVRIRQLLETIVADRAGDDPDLGYLDGLRLFDADDAAQGLLPDGLHPNEQGYLMMAQRFARALPEVMPQAALTATAPALIGS